MRYTKQDMGKTVAPHLPQSFITDEPTLPSGEYAPCPTCNTKGTVRIDFINRTSKNLNGYIAKPGVNVEYRECSRCEGTGEVWIEDKA